LYQPQPLDMSHT